MMLSHTIYIITLVINSRRFAIRTYGNGNLMFPSTLIWL